MSRLLNNRLTEMELRVRYPVLTRTILVAISDYDVELETHDSVRAKLHIRPEVGIRDLLVHSLNMGEPPRLKMPNVWENMIYKPVETVVAVESGGDIPPPSPP